ncbi:MAG: BrnT family toxin [Oligoflexales bacterium]|nr:BrnT family toxin [Oligoflexales bacterium]
MKGNELVRIEWDPVKAAKNFKKHRVSFELATTVFDDPFALSIPDQYLHAEERWITLGVTINQTMIVVVHTEICIFQGMETIRIISARKATSKERRWYEKGI